MSSTPTDQREFAEYARRWLKENAPPPPPERMPVLPIEVGAGPLCEYLRDWQRKCYDAGLVGADLPKEYGGGGHQGFQRIANREMSLAGTPYMVNVVALSMAIPTLLVHGTEEQKKRFIPKALRCEEIWCQGFSEPGAGSDLANAQTSAVRDGEDWIVNGHKVWTSLGQIAQWMILLARTSKDHKYDGLTYFLCPIEGHPGVTVKPLIKMTGDSGFNEVFFENVRIPDSLRLDAVGKGWTVAMTTLTYERGAAEGAGGGGGDRGSAIERLIELARKSYRNGVRASDDPHTRDAIVQRAIVQEGMMQNMRRSRVPALCDHPMRLPLQMKVTGSEYAQHNARLGMDIAGAHSTLYKLDPAAPDDARWPIEYLDSYGHTIAAGANEIQRNILGERVLGLPKSK
jgi:alkylation response protein AidB-like acyl-CoA dehydrogenase